MLQTNKTKKMVTIAMIAALYAVITLAIAPIAFSTVQFRVSEMLTVLPMFTPLAIPGLTLGCALANLVGALSGINPIGYIDAVVGSSATLIASLLSYLIAKNGKNWIKYTFVPLPPVLVNAVIVGIELTVLFNSGENFSKAFIANGISVLIGQLVICYSLGMLLMVSLNRKDIHKKIFAN